MKLIAVLLAGAVLLQARADIFELPTANRALYEANGEERFLAPTPGKTWTSGSFGCVRTDGWQMHEGLDIKSLQHDKKGEPTDPVMATANGTVAYINRKSGLSNYGNYIVLRHSIDGFEVHSLYAHLQSIDENLKPGQSVVVGQKIGIMGRTSNTSEHIGKERAHVHFEFDLVLNDRFDKWYKESYPTQRNDHQNWNGLNLMGLDPRLILMAQHGQGTNFHLVNWIQHETELLRVLVHVKNIPWAKRYPQLVHHNPAAEKEGIEGYEIGIDYNGVPISLTPRTASDFKTNTKFQLIGVNEAEYKKNPCRRLVIQTGGKWGLASNGTKLLDLLVY